jgi:hypothetical protein
VLISPGPLHAPVSTPFFGAEVAATEKGGQGQSAVVVAKATTFVTSSWQVPIAQHAACTPWREFDETDRLSAGGVDAAESEIIVGRAGMAGAAATVGLGKALEEIFRPRAR